MGKKDRARLKCTKCLQWALTFSTALLRTMLADMDHNDLSYREDIEAGKEESLAESYTSSK